MHVKINVQRVKLIRTGPRLIKFASVIVALLLRII